MYTESDGTPHHGASFPDAHVAFTLDPIQTCHFDGRAGDGVYGTSHAWCLSPHGQVERSSPNTRSPAHDAASPLAT